MPATLKDVRRLAKKFGAKVEVDNGGLTRVVMVEAPKGHVWKCDDLHELVDSVYKGPWPQDYDDMIERMNYGIAKCEIPDCEWCHPEEEQ